MISRAVAEAVLDDAIAACDPTARVQAALAALRIVRPGRLVRAFAVGKAARAMARGAPRPGLVVIPAGSRRDGLDGWEVYEAPHPVPDARSVVAGEAVRAFVEAAAPDEVVVALISGGASSLIEVPRIPLDDFVARTRAVMASGAPIAELNAARGALSTIKAGQLARRSRAPIVTLAISDVIGDDLAVIGSGPTIPPRPQDVAQVIAPLAAASHAAVDALAARGIAAARVAIAGDVMQVADQLAAMAAPVVGWGEPTLRVPPGAGEGGRAQQLALALAHRLRGGDRSAFVVGTDGIDGPPPAQRPPPAGAWIDGRTWDAIIAAGIDPAAALARCDAGTALAAVGALVVIGPSGINHADLAIVG